MLKKKTKRQRLNFQHRVRCLMTCDAELQNLMRKLWLFKRQVKREKPYLGDYYAEAFEDFLFNNRVPKMVPKVKRQKTRVHLTESASKHLKDMQKIARKRQQPLSVIIEEAIRVYLQKSENLLGSTEYPVEHKEYVS